MTVEDGERIQAVGIDEPAGAARGDSGETPAHVVAAAQLRLFGDEQAQEGASYVAETDDRQVVGWNGDLLDRFTPTESLPRDSPGNELEVLRASCRMRSG